MSEKLKLKFVRGRSVCERVCDVSLRPWKEVVIFVFCFFPELKFCFNENFLLQSRTRISLGKQIGVLSVFKQKNLLITAFNQKKILTNIV